MENVKITSDALPPFPTFLYNEGKAKFVLFYENFGSVIGQKKSRMVLLYMSKIYGILYNSDKYKTSSDVWNVSRTIINTQ
jgi:hypothetical protein